MAREIPKAVRRWLVLAGLSLAGAGCVYHNWDEITSRDFKVKDLYKNPDPMTVLRENPDGDARAKAMNRLKEPAKNGRPTAEQDEAVAILSRQAVSAPEPLCRLAAIGALGRFEDSRTTAPLVQAYHSAGGEKNFTPEIANQVRTAAISGLGHKHQPEALALLIQVASKVESKPAVTQAVSFPGESSLLNQDSPAVRETRLAALRALGLSHNPQAIPALLPHLSDKDVAMRDEAQKSLEMITGHKNVPPDAQSWQAAIAGGHKPN